MRQFRVDEPSKVIQHYMCLPNSSFLEHKFVVPGFGVAARFALSVQAGDRVLLLETEL